MLNLAAPTDPAWTRCALANLDDVLVDHAHCEQKAAGMAVRLLFRYGSHGFLLEPLSRIAREELVHFEAVLRLLEARGVPFGRQRPGAYAGRLRRAVRAHEPERLLDTLLCCALIEARSCERFQILAAAVDDAELAAFYGGLLEAEARHHGIYVDLARKLAPEEAVQTRLQDLARSEARILAESAQSAGARGPAMLPRMHG